MGTFYRQRSPKLRSSSPRFLTTDKANYRALARWAGDGVWSTKEGCPSVSPIPPLRQSTGWPRSGVWTCRRHAASARRVACAWVIFVQACSDPWSRQCRLGLRKHDRVVERRVGTGARITPRPRADCRARLRGLGHCRIGFPRSYRASNRTERVSASTPYTIGGSRSWMTSGAMDDFFLICFSPSVTGTPSIVAVVLWRSGHDLPQFWDRWTARHGSGIDAFPPRP